MTDLTRLTAAETRRGASRRKRGQRRRGRPGPPRPHRRRRRPGPRLPARRRRGCARAGRRASTPASSPVRSPACPSRSRTSSAPRASRPRSGSRILEGWRPPYDATRHRAAQGRRRGDPRQDQHGRVRHGLLHRAQRLRPHAQPLGPRPDPGRQRRRVERGARQLPGAAGHRHRHRRLDPPARRASPARSASSRRTAGSAATASSPSPAASTRPGPAPAPSWTPRCCTRSSPATTRGTPRRIDAPVPAGRRGRPARRRQGPAGRCRQASSPARATSPACRRASTRRSQVLRELGATVDRGQLPALPVRAAGLLPDRAQRGVEQPGPLRRRPLRPARRRRRRARPRGGHGADPCAGLRRGGEAPHHPRHLRAVQRLLRRLLRPGAEGPHPHHAGLPARRSGVRRRARRADLPDRRVPARAPSSTTRSRCTARTSRASPPTCTADRPPPSRPACPRACRWGCR